MITGGKGRGKTTLLELLVQKGDLPGLRSVAERDRNGHPIRVILEERRGGGRCVIGERTERGMEPVPGALDTAGVEFARRVRQEQSQWAVVDEIGFLEEASPKYQRALEELFEEKRILAALRKEKLPFLERLCARQDSLVLDLDCPDWVKRYGCVVLAAGQGRRFGDNKLLHPLAGKPMLSWVLESIPREYLADIVAVCASDGVERLCLKHGISAVRYSGGPQSRSLQIGLERLIELDGCMFLMGDQPLCRDSSMKRILEMGLERPEDILRLGWRGGACSPTLFPQKYFPALMALEGERGGMAAVHRIGAGVTLVEASGEEELWDVDTASDLKKIEEYLSHKRKSECL